MKIFLIKIIYIKIILIYYYKKNIKIMINLININNKNWMKINYKILLIYYKKYIKKKIYNNCNKLLIIHIKQ